VSVSRFTQLGAADAIGALDSGVYVGEHEDFSVRRVKSGEYLTTSFVYDKDEEPLAMVYSSLLQGLDPLDDPQSQVGEDEAISQNVDESLFHRSLMIADLDDNVFSCEVDVIRTKPAATSPVDDVLDSETLLWTMPCAPAMFGPSHISILKDGSELVLQK
jgi:hypothetical protein